MPQIHFIADDFGLSPEVNRAILKAHREGALHGAGLMLGQPATEEAVELARRTPSLAVGWHLHLADSRPLTVARWPWGHSPAAAGFALGLLPSARRLARAEISAQWRAFRATGLDCRFVNAHHHLQIHPLVRRELVATLGGEFDGWLRWGRVRFFEGGLGELAYRLLDLALHAPHRPRLPFELTTTVWGFDRLCAMRAAEVRRVVAGLGEGRHEFVFHPRRVEGDVDTRCLLELGEG